MKRTNWFILLLFVWLTVGCNVADFNIPSGEQAYLTAVYDDVNDLFDVVDFVVRDPSTPPEADTFVIPAGYQAYLTAVYDADNDLHDVKEYVLIERGLVSVLAYWRFDEAGIDVDRVEEITDSQMNLIPYDGGSGYGTGHDGNAVQIVGPDAVGELTTTSTGVTSPWESHPDGFCLGFWFKVSADPEDWWSAVMVDYKTYHGAFSGFACAPNILYDSGDWYISTYYQTEAGSAQYIDGSSQTCDDVWHYYLFVYDKAAGTNTVYIDGEVYGTPVSSDNYVDNGVEKVWLKVGDYVEYEDTLILLDDLKIAQFGQSVVSRGYI